MYRITVIDTEIIYKASQGFEEWNRFGARRQIRT